MNITFKYLHLLCFLVCSSDVIAQTNSNTIFSVELPQTENKKVYQTISYQCFNSFTGTIHIQCYQVKQPDTNWLFDYSFESVDFKKGTHATQLDLGKATKTSTQNKSFLDVIRKFDIVPPGVYSINMAIDAESIHFKRVYLFTVDSNLAYNSGLRNEVNKAFEGDFNGKGASNKDKHPATPISEEEVKRIDNKIAHKIGKSGITTQIETINGTPFSYLYSSGWFLGRYEIKGAHDIKESVSREERMIKTNITSLVSNNLEGFEPVGAQMKKLNKKNKDEEEVKGNIDLNSYFSTGQEPGSMQDQNYEELHGIVETKVMGLPVAVEGFYTTQDIHRKIKASYIRVHYDIEQQKSDMSSTLNGYKSKFSETAAKGQGLEASGQSYLNNLTSEKNKLLYELGKEYGLNARQLEGNNVDISKLISEDTSMLIRKAEATADGKVKSDSAAIKTREKSEKLRKKFERLLELEKQITKYATLLDQFKNQNYLDSAINYSKISKLTETDDVSYKQMVKAGQGLLPESKTSKFISGITHFDAGIINKYESDYTVAGQAIKGGSMGYDFNFVQLGLTAGKTEYISRDGNIDQYNSYLTRLNFRQIKRQKVSLIYYNYSPSKKMLREDAFFKDGVSVPSFINPIHVVSLNYDGVITKFLTIHSEGATSYRARENTNFIGSDHGALKTSLECLIPKTNATISGEWEHVGDKFDNNSLPYTKAATERYTLSASADFLHSFLSAGLQYNYLKQSSFSTTGFSTKWGFDLSTHSRRWPSVSISYKPFATFRTYTDTLNIPQRPLTGAVCIAKGSYQFKNSGLSHRFMVIYNQNASTEDTQRYSSKMLQISYILSSKTGMFNVNAGWMQLPVYDMVLYVPSNSAFLSINGATSINEKIDINLGEEVGIASFGLQRSSTTAGIGYEIKKLLLRLRLQSRYTNYKLASNSSSQNLFAGQIGINWDFKTSSPTTKLRNRIR